MVELNELVVKEYKIVSEKPISSKMKDDEVVGASVNFGNLQFMFTVSPQTEMKLHITSPFSMDTGKYTGFTPASLVGYRSSSNGINVISNDGKTIYVGSGSYPQ